MKISVHMDLDSSFQKNVSFSWEQFWTGVTGVTWAEIGAPDRVSDARRRFQLFQICNPHADIFTPRFTLY
jgi:hypothetical protein